MPLQLGEFIVAGEIDNRRRNSVNGWFALDEERWIKIELTGNLGGELAGHRFRFEVNRANPFALDDETFQRIHLPQVGTPGVASVRAPDEPALSTGANSFPAGEYPRLFLEWHSQNGHLVVEIFRPHIEFDYPDDPPGKPQAQNPDESNSAEGSPSDPFDDESEDPFNLLGEPSEEDDPYQLFEPDLEDAIRQSSADDDADTDEHDLGDPELGEGDSAFENVEDRSLRSWEEVIPGIDPETKQLYEQWDEIVYGTRDEPLSTMFDPPIELPPVAQVTSEDRAESLIQTLLARLALHGVAIDVCEHYDYVSLYRYLMTEVLPIANIHPNLPASRWVQHYSTWESCPECERAFDEEYDAREAKRPPESDDN